MNRSVKLMVTTGASLIALAPATLAAQTSAPVPQLTAPTREEVNREPIGPDPRTPSRLTVEGGVERAPCPLADPRYAALTVTVSDVRFDNLKVVPAADLRPAFEEFVGRTLPIATVCEIRDRAATILRRRGYLAAVQVPAQRIENGVVRLDVLMARLVSVQVRGDAGRSEALIAGYLNRLVDQPVFNEQQAARYLLLARDLPGYDIRLTLRPAGTAPGEVVGEVTVARTPYAIDVNIQNFGSKDVGRFGGLLRGEFYDLLGRGDRLTLGYFATSDFSEQNVLQGGYDARIGSEGLTLGSRITHAWTRPDLGTAVAPRAKTLVASVEVGYPFVRTEAANLRGVAGLDLIDQRVRFADTPLSRDKLRILYGRLDYDAIDRASIGGRPGYSSIEPRWRLAGSLEFRQGLDLLGASDGCGPAPYLRCLPTTTAPASQLTLSRIEGDPTATVVRLVGVAEYRPVAAFTIAVQPRAQYSWSPLVIYEEYSAGNYTVGRGYDPGTIIGDRGIGFAAELRYGSIVPRSLTAFAIQPYALLDAAWVWNERSPIRPPEPDPQTLWSAGGGVRVSYGDRARLDVGLAVPLRRAGFQSRRSDPRLLVSLTTRLLPWTRP